MTPELNALIRDGGIDPAPLFDIAAHSLIAEYGTGALALADHALGRMDVLGDEDGLALWHGVKTAIRRRLPGNPCGGGPVVH
ncbi:MAG: hypothetical protein WEB93_03825 [Sphingomonadales bacterium]